MRFIQNNAYMRIKIFILLLAISLTAAAVPARKGKVMLEQPDGSRIEALLSGDEFMRIKTTADGRSIIQDEDGWWCYAVFDENGHRHSSGYKVGSPAPAAVLHESRNIPFKKLASIAAEKRSSLSVYDRTPISRKLISPAATKAEPAVKHGLVILAQFKDVSFRYGKNDFENLLLQKGYGLHGATGCAKEYFDTQFEGKVEFDFHVSDIITLPRNRAYYGGNTSDGDDKNPAEMIADACKALDDRIDFSIFDDDNDGYTDNVFVFFAGDDEAEGAAEEAIWSHSWHLLRGAGIRLELDGKIIDSYACSSELTKVFNGPHTYEYLSGIGTFCHEYGHTLGLPDFYDTDYEETGGWAAGLWGRTSLMDSGNRNNNGNTPPCFNSIERYLLGLAEPVVLEKTGTYTLEPISKGGGSYRLDTDTDGEFYLFECRNESGWDAYIGGKGMLVYHIDRSEGVLRKWTNSNDLNTDFTHQCADLIEADSRQETFSNINDMYDRTQNIKGIFFPYGQVTSLTAESRPGLQFWSGKTCMYSITSIRKEGDDIKFNLVDNKESSSPPVATDIDYTVFADGAIVRFESSYSYDGDATVRWGRPDNEGETVSISPYSPGKYCIILKDLESGGKTYNVDILFKANNLEGETRKISLMTKRAPEVDWPYIYINAKDKNDDGTVSNGTRIPLWVNNASGAAETKWFFNGNEITHEGDGFRTFNSSGTLKAKVLWKDGRTDIIEKEVKTSTQ